MFGEWAINQISLHAPGFWLLVSLVASGVVLYLEPRWSRAQLRSQWRTLWALQRVLIPYLGLVLGALSPRLMGLNQLDWDAGLGVGLLLIVVVGTLLVLVRATVDLPDTWEEQHRGQPVRRPAHVDRSPRAMRQSLVSTVAICGVREFQWVFLRGAIWEMLLMLPTPPATPGYWAIWLAAGLVLLEVLARRLIFAQTIFQLVILICTSILFLYTLNFWLCWILHAIAYIVAAPTSLRATVPHINWRRAPR